MELFKKPVAKLSLGLSMGFTLGLSFGSSLSPLLMPGAAFAAESTEALTSMVRYCNDPTRKTCTCPDGFVPQEQNFFLNPEDFQGETYRCSSIKSITKIWPEAPQLNVMLGGATLPCSNIPSDSSLKLNGKSVTLGQEQFGLPPTAQISSLFPNGCGYKFRGFNRHAYEDTVKKLVKEDKILCGGKQHANCTSATFLVFLKSLKVLRDQGRVSETMIQQWSNLNGLPWQLLNEKARPDLLVTQLRDAKGSPLGTGKFISTPDIPDPEWPKPGDFVQFWRNNLSGHSVIFQGYLKDNQGKAIGVCYWSANEGTQGYANRCENIKNLSTMAIGRINFAKETP